MTKYNITKEGKAWPTTRLQETMSKTLLTLAMIATAIIVTAAPASATDGKQSTTGDSKPAATAPKAEPTKHTVAEGEYLELIGQKYDVEWVRIWAANPQLQNQDIVDVGDVLIIPTSDEKLDDSPLVQSAPVAPTATVHTSNTPQLATPTSPRPVVAGNGYVPGNCTWYVKNRRPDIGNYWGDAGYSWIANARAAGYSTGATPRAGAIGVTPGHVVYVESVNADGTANISEMNWGALYRMNSRTVPAGAFTYIY